MGEEERGEGERMGSGVQKSGGQIGEGPPTSARGKLEDSTGGEDSSEKGRRER